MKRGLLAACAVLTAAPAAAQHFTLGPQVALVDYGEVSSNLRYSGVGPGASASLRAGRMTVEGTVLSVQMDPKSGSGAAEGFRTTEIEGRVRCDVTGYLGLEVGLTSRTTDSEFAAQGVGAATIGARTQYLLGPGAWVWARGSYLAAAQFSGGGSAPLSFGIGLGVDVTVLRHVRFTADYAFEKYGRKTEPGGGPEVNAPIEESHARLGVAAAF